MIDCQLQQWCKGEPLNCNDSNQMMQVMDYLDGECAYLILDDTTGIEDSVLVVKRNGFWKVEEIYLDLAKSDRELETWDYIAANDKRVKVDERLYLRTIGFD